MPRLLRSSLLWLAAGLALLPSAAAPEPDARGSVPLLELDGAPWELAAATGTPLRIALPGLGERLVEVEPSPLHADGGFQVERLDGKGRVDATEPLELAPLLGRVVGDPSSWLAVTVGPGGLSGMLQADGLRFWLEATPNGTEVRQAGTAQPLPPHGPWELRVLEVQPFADASLQRADPGFARRIVDAYNAQAPMWRAQAGIELRLLPIQALAEDVSASLGCSGHLDAFRPRIRGDAAQLFTGLDLDGCKGNARSPGTPGRASASPRSVVAAWDGGGSASYDPRIPFELAVVSAHELAHLWGEPHHPVGAVPGVMATGTPHPLRALLLDDAEGSTAERVRRGTARMG